MEESKKENEILKPKKCLRCGEFNPATNRVCRRCFFPLDNSAERILEREVRREVIDAVIETLWNDREFREIFMKKVREAKALI